MATTSPTADERPAHSAARLNFELSWLCWSNEQASRPEYGNYVCTINHSLIFDKHIKTKDDLCVLFTWDLCLVPFGGTGSTALKKRFGLQEERGSKQATFLKWPDRISRLISTMQQDCAASKPAKKPVACY